MLTFLKIMFYNYLPPAGTDKSPSSNGDSDGENPVQSGRHLESSMVTVDWHPVETDQQSTTLRPLVVRSSQDEHVVSEGQPRNASSSQISFNVTVRENVNSGGSEGRVARTIITQSEGAEPVSVVVSVGFFGGQSGSYRVERGVSLGSTSPLRRGLGRDSAAIDDDVASQNSDQEEEGDHKEMLPK